jgi:DNA-binding CsgD family transcriptional regulator
MARARDVAFIRKLCSLELAPHVLTQSLLPALRVLIPSHSAGVFWVDDSGEMTGLYAERMLPPDVMAAYYERHYRHTQDGFATAFRRRAQAPDPVTYHSFTAKEQESDYFREVLSRLDAYHVLYGILRNGKRAVAQVSFYRGRRDLPFDGAAANALRPLLGYIAAAVERVPVAAQPQEGNVTVEESLGIVDAQGTVTSGTDAWLRLVRLAALAQVSPREAREEPRVIGEFLHRISQQVLAFESSGAVRNEFTWDTTWGRFTVHAFRLTDRKGRRADQVGVLIRRAEPRTLALVRGAGRSSLSPQQREVALLLARGKTNREIAEVLGLTFNTASYHVKQIYARLDVNTRSDVADTLLGLANLRVS